MIPSQSQGFSKFSFHGKAICQSFKRGLIPIMGNGFQFERIPSFIKNLLVHVLRLTSGECCTAIKNLGWSLKSYPDDKKSILSLWDFYSKTIKIAAFWGTVLRTHCREGIVIKKLTRSKSNLWPLDCKECTLPLCNENGWEKKS